MFTSLTRSILNAKSFFRNTDVGKNLEKDVNFLRFIGKTTKIFTKPITWSFKPIKILGSKLGPKKALTYGMYGIGSYSSAQEGVDKFYKLSHERENVMDKKANLSSVTSTILSKIPEAFGSSLGSALAGATAAGVGLGVAMIANKAQTAMVTNQARRAFEEALRDPELANADKRKLEQFFMTILRFSPKVATDPVLLKNYLKQALVYGTVDIQTIRALQDVQKNMGVGEPSLIRKLI